MNVSEAVVMRIKQLLKEKDISLYKLGQLTGLLHETIKSIMKNKAKGVNLKTIIIIADGFKMTPSEFLNSELFIYDNLNLD